MTDHADTILNDEPTRADPYTRIAWLTTQIERLEGELQQAQAERDDLKADVEALNGYLDASQEARQQAIDALREAAKLDPVNARKRVRAALESLDESTHE